MGVVEVPLRYHLEPLELRLPMPKLLAALVAGDSRLSPLLELLGESQPTLLLHGTNGAIGFGESLRLSAGGPNRFAELAAAWGRLLDTSSNQSGASAEPSPLFAFGSISFAANSERRSELLVPRLVIYSDDSSCWILLTELEASGGRELAGAAAAINRSLAQWLSDLATSEEPATGALRTVAEASAAQHERGHLIAPRQGQIEQRESFTAKVSAALEAISRGEVEKVVLARAIDLGEADSEDLLEVAARLAGANPDSWIYLVSDSVGASPELLLRLERGRVRARVLAGTASRGTDQGVDRAIADALVRSEKNLAEHEYAVASLTAGLERHCAAVEREGPYALALPKLWHLATDVSATLTDSSSALELLSDLHPTAAVAGTPVAAAVELISRLEGFDRGGYAGPVGWLRGTEAAEWVIALRGAEMRGDRLIGFAGCGIVAGSEPLAEYEETELKFAAIRASVES